MRSVRRALGVGAVLGAVECWGTGPLATPTQKTVVETSPSTAPDPATAAGADRDWTGSYTLFVAEA